MRSLFVGRQGGVLDPVESRSLIIDLILSLRRGGARHSREQKSNYRLNPPLEKGRYSTPVEGRGQYLQICMLLKESKILIGALIFLALVLGILMILLLMPRKESVIKGQVKNEIANSSSDIVAENGISQNDNIAGTATSSTELSLAPAAASQIIIAFGGDVMLSRAVGQKMERYQDWTWPLAKVSKIFDSADLAVINLESPSTIGGSHFVPAGSFSFNADPRSIAGLGAAGIDLAMLANNHLLNQGRQGLSDTLEMLERNNIGYAGAGNDAGEAHQGAIMEAQGVRFGFLAYGYPDDYSVAGDNRSGIANMDLAAMREDVARMKADADAVIISMHAGNEYAREPNKQQKEFARAAIDAGADLVIGHHPHWVQTTEIYRGKLIIYSLGNLVFDQMWSRPTQQGAIVKAYFSGKELRQAEIIPVHIYDYGQPDVAAGKEADEILGRMGLDEGVINIKY